MQGRRQLGNCLERLPEVHSGSAQHRVVFISVGFLQPTPAHPMLLLEMADARFDRGATFHSFPHAFRSRVPTTFVYMDLAGFFIVVSAVAHIDEGMFRCGDDAFNLLNSNPWPGSKR
ncbi:MAG: hypothetical protein JXR25_17745 [Pontiellaceae bacterium]|nr:hypothetical protein [Pontiellaceae bacterium]MBN2786665.1 hypothetical protein [Pontiellaceae bacterium]